MKINVKKVLYKSQIVTAASAWENLRLQKYPQDSLVLRVYPRYKVPDQVSTRDDLL